jgi:predicted transcriptional regulator
MSGSAVDVLGLTAQIVSAHISNNQISTEALPLLIQDVYRSPAVPVKKSVFPDYLICLEDGKKLKMLKRHLRTSYSMTPHEYRTKWGLPQDYPMVAPAYASHRSTLAKKIGLGRKASETEPTPPPLPVAKPAARRAKAAKG